MMEVVVNAEASYLGLCSSSKFAVHVGVQPRITRAMAMSPEPVMKSRRVS